jgi:trehalose-phosphatase
LHALTSKAATGMKPVKGMSVSETVSALLEAPEMTFSQESARYAAQTRLLFCADFDGTLTPIKPHPDKVELSGTVKRLLWNLSRLPDTAVAIVSGRSVFDLQQKVALTQLWYVGNHGLEIIGPDASYLHPETEQIRPVLGAWLARLRKKLAGIGGCYIEDKQYTASVHFRRVKPESRPGIEAIVRQTRPPNFVVMPGKMVWELRPVVDWHKGWGITWLAEKLAAPVVYLGDDRTDEDAFTMLGDHALTIKVGTRPTAARFLLRSVNAVIAWLSQFFEARREALAAWSLPSVGGAEADESEIQAGAAK